MNFNLTRHIYIIQAFNIKIRRILFIIRQLTSESHKEKFNDTLGPK